MSFSFSHRTSVNKYFIPRQIVESNCISGVITHNKIPKAIFISKKILSTEMVHVETNQSALNDFQLV
jgi:hypothetical protein